MSIAQVIFGSIHSPPMGIITESIEELYRTYYRSVIKSLYAYPQIHSVLFLSGNLLEWIEKHHGEFFTVITDMVKERRLELLGGGYYSPMMNLISRQDCIGQIELLTTYIRRNFGRRPRGCWVTEQIWEPSFPSILRSAGIEYAFLSEYHFWKAGFEERDFCKPCITEDQGKTILAFPIIHEIYQNFWQMSPDDIQKKIEDQISSSNDDNQVISILHTSHNPPEHMNAKQVEAHINLVLKHLNELVNEQRITTVLPSRYINLQKKRQFSRGYFPPTSFDEMQAFGSMPAFEKYLQQKGTITNGMRRTGYYYGSFFRQNLSRYEEANLIYAKMQFVQGLTNQIRGDKYRRQSAREELWRGQSNAAFWHGAYGGVYINNYRKEVYSALIRSEKLAREQGVFARSILFLDFDMDGIDEYLYQGNTINAYIHSVGGLLFELDYLPRPWNYLDTMGRYIEAYHSEAQHARGYDVYPRRCFIDHFLNAETSIEQFSRMIFDDQCDFVHKPYNLDSSEGVVKKKLEIPLSVEGKIRQVNGECLIRLEKKYSFDRRVVQVEYNIINTDQRDIHTIFAPEINLSFLSDRLEDLRLYRIINKNNKTEIDSSLLKLNLSTGIELLDQFNKVRIEINFSPDAECWCHSVETEHLNMDRWQQNYQASSILPRWNINLKPGEKMLCHLRISLSSIKKSKLYS